MQQLQFNLMDEPPRSGKGGRPRFKEENYQAYYELHDQGYSLQQIADHFNVTRTIVYNGINRYKKEQLKK